MSHASPQPNEQILATVAVPIAVPDLVTITGVLDRRAKKENRTCYMRQEGQFLIFFTLPTHQKPTP